MDSEKCTILLSILKNGSMSAAAAELNYTQSGISRAIEALEKSVGFQVLSRGRGGVHLTREGEELLPSMREIAYWSEQFDQTVQKLRGVQGEKRTYRTLSIDGEEFEFSQGFTELHTESYRRILSGEGFRIAEARPCIEIVSQIRHAEPIGLVGDYHPLAKLPLAKHPFGWDEKR